MSEYQKEKVCCFTGHRSMKDFKEVNIKMLHYAIGRMISIGITAFIAGGARGFDTYAAEQIIKYRKVNRHIKLVLVLPCAKTAQTKNWNAKDIARYDAILEQANEVIYVSESYHDGCMRKRNARMVEMSSYCICYLTKTGTGTSQTVDMARKNGLTVINIAN
ncbi:MAG: SLOG family protein [Oscillospiraceae bacterium]